MSTDRELLEAAAKAIGRTLTWDGDNPPYPRAREDHWNPHWNPLESDGDALRLAVKMNLNIAYDPAPDGPMVCVSAPWCDDFPDYFWFEWLLKDAPAATRRAIVRAAAQIGAAA